MTESDRPPEPDAEALGAATASVRRLIAHLRKTTAPRDLLESFTREAEALADRLEPHDHPGPYAQRHLYFRLENTPPDDESPSEYFPYSPVVGALNPLAPPIAFDFDAEAGEMHAEHVFDAPYNGPPTAVHGGVIALVFDELLGSTGVMNQCGGFTGTLSIRYRSITPLHQPIRMRGWVDRREGRKVFIAGTMHDGDTLCAEAEGIFIQPADGVAQAAFAQNAARHPSD
jgi:acyl-coenzyme A thioesterase PaaI-like protein